MIPSSVGIAQAETKCHDAEILHAEELLRAGAPNEDELLIWLNDWRKELEIVEGRDE